MWLKIYKEDWPHLPKYSALIQHMKTGCYEPVKENIVTKEITKTFASSENHDLKFILIEGAPGIGKTVLTKEIAYQWSKNQVLKNKKLVVLLPLQDPSVQKMTKVCDLLRSLVHRDKKITSACSGAMYNLSKNGGKEVAFLFDGFDELPETLQKDSIFVDIIKRKVLPHCAVVVSSRPCASKILHHRAAIKIEILSLTVDDAKCHIKTAMEGQPHKINDLTQFLNNQPIINDFLIPSNLAVLVDLSKRKDSLPKSYTDLYNEFICCTICRYLTKDDERDITKLTNLPEPYNRIIKQLAKFAFDALEKGKLIFTLDEIKGACLGIKVDDLYGLLKPQCFTFHTTLSFIHFTVQEFLAAYYLSTLSSNELELTFLKEKFWHDDYFNVFTFYMGLTKGQRPSFKKFLSDKETVPLSFKFLDDKLKCLRLYPYFHEAGYIEICNSLEQSQAFMNQAIDLAHTSLSLIDVKCTTFFLVSSNIKWHELNLRDCCIQDLGVHILYSALCCASKNIQITTLQLSYNCLTEASSFMISEIVIKCKVQKLRINGNHFIGETHKLCSMLADDSTTLVQLHMVDIKLSSRGATSIFIALMNNNTLKELVITDNNITDDAREAITKALKDNRSLVKLWMWNNPIRTEALVSIVKILQSNNTLALLGLPNCPEKTKVILSTLQQKVNKKRENQGCKVKLVIDFM